VTREGLKTSKIGFNHARNNWTKSRNDQRF
jgi:hypothetical protein